MGRVLGKYRAGVFSVSPNYNMFAVYIICLVVIFFNMRLILRPGQYLVPKETYRSTHITQHFAVANFVESLDQLYGVYSIHNQLIKHGMIRGRSDSSLDTATNDNDNSGNRNWVSHVIVVPSDIEERYRNALVLWVGEDNLRTVDKNHILGKMQDKQNLWKPTFNKLWLHNLTDFDKIIMLDCDILIRTSIMHWFDYPTPCGIQAKDDLAWNSGAMVIKPDTQIFQQMLRRLPDVQRYEKGSHKKDPLTAGYSDQDFTTAFFINTTKQGKQRCVMPTEAAALISSIGDSTGFDYYNNYHQQIYQTVHFTTLKPWRDGHQSSHPFVCALLCEWNASMHGIEEYYNSTIPPMQNNPLEKCGVNSKQ